MEQIKIKYTELLNYYTRRFEFLHSIIVKLLWEQEGVHEADKKEQSEILARAKMMSIRLEERIILCRMFLNDMSSK